MKKAFALAGLLAAMSACAEDSYLYWMVGDTTPYSYTVAKVKDTTTDRYLTIYDDIGILGSEISSEVLGSYGPGEALFASLTSAGSGSGSSFIVELFSGDTFVAQSSPLAYNSQYLAIGGMTLAQNVWIASSFAVPEPSSSMLLLVGCAALGLRRRRQKRA